MIGELELAWRLLPQRFVAVTGTNGKTTTVELLGAIWRAAGLPVAVAGNVGTPLSALPGSLAEDATVVCECSSFQLEDASEFAPECAVLLNVEPDHLDRHRDLDRYRAAKMKLFAHSPEHVVMPEDLSTTPSTSARCACAASTTARTHARRRSRRMRWGCRATPSARRSARSPACRTGWRRSASFGGVLAVNDSKATNVAAAVRGIEAFEGGVHVILGGSLKGEGFEGLRGALSSRAGRAYLIGEAAERLAADLDGACELLRCGTLERAVDGGGEGGGARGGGAALPGVRIVRRVPRLRGARRALPRARSGGAVRSSTAMRDKVRTAAAE